ncbi:MAG: hypothetical protein J4G06_05550 [Caldilineaceae bacterium]|nr:hypothetical protein [Caldilineaceae bacterium]
MDISQTSSKVTRVMATLRHFGFVNRTGKGEYTVSEMAKRVLYPATSGERSDVLRTAATRPAVFRQIFDRFPSRVPPIEAVVSHLKREGFADAAAKSAAKVFVEAARFTDLYAEVLDGEGPMTDFESSRDRESANRSGYGQTDSLASTALDPSRGFDDWLVLPVGQGVVVRIQVQGQLDRAGIEHLRQVLKLQKDTLPAGNAGLWANAEDSE